MEESRFFERPILNSPYEYPGRHWELDVSGQPTQKISETRRRAEFITPIPKPRKQKGGGKQESLLFDEGKGLSTRDQQYDHTAIINSVRLEVDKWRALPSPNDWRVTPETARLLQHWRHHAFSGVRPFFCQVEAVETAIWLTEVAPQIGKVGQTFIEHLASANQEANPGLMRLALKLATGAGKTTVMAMLIAWQTINAVRRPGSKRFTRGFLIVAPGLTIRDRLRVLRPNDPDSYFKSRELVPGDMLADLDRAKIVITNYHSFKLRERIELSKGGRLLLQGRGGEDLDTLETEGQMLQRVMPDLMGMGNILVINDEAHHCYREKAGAAAEDDELKGEDRKEAEENNEAARLWISGLEAVNRKLGVARILDLSATPFFLRGSGYAEGTLFPWTLCDFSLMDAIECGIVKLPRVPVADNIPGAEMPMFRNLWEHIRAKMPKKGRGKAEGLNPLDLPTQLQTALQALYGHYEKTFALWAEEKVSVPPCFIVVCNNTSASKLVYDYISGFYRPAKDGQQQLEFGRLPLFRNHDENGKAFGRPRTLLIDSEQLESGEALDEGFRGVATDEIERFRREIETVTALDHPNIVKIIAFGQDDDFYYYAMEFLEGRSLRELIHDRGHLSPFYAAEITRDAARGLAHAHKHGVIHRDVKPSNLMICKDGVVKIVDFGLAFKKQSPNLTATGLSLGTPAYMSPEQIEGGRSEVSERSDIYSLGVTLYEAVTGRRPFEGDNHYDVLKRVLFDQPPSALEVNAGLPRALSEIIARAMSKAPQDRYAHMDEFAHVLEGFIERESNG